MKNVQITGTFRSNWRTDGIGSSFVLELLPSPSSRNVFDEFVDIADLIAVPQFEQDDGIDALTFARSSSKYRHNSLSSKLSRINSCCLSSN